MRDEAAAEALLDAGVARVVLGTAALERPELVDRLAGAGPAGSPSGLDVRGARGGRARLGRGRRAGSCSTCVREFEDSGVAAVVVTQIDVDGIGTGPDLDTYAELLADDRARRRSPRAASASLDDLRDARRARRRRPRARRRHRRPGALRGRVHRRRRAGRHDERGLTMRTARVIPCLDVDAGRVVKGVNFVGLRDAGDPVELAARYDAEGADELVFLDITASTDARDTIVDVVGADRRAGLHPVHRRRRHPLGRRRPRAPAGRGRQGVAEHRRGRPAPS